MMSDLFSSWNAALLEEYFSRTSEGEEVWIQSSRSELDAFGLYLGGAEGLIEAVKVGPSWCAHSWREPAVAAQTLVWQRGYQKRRHPSYLDPGELLQRFELLDAPAYLPYIALWVLAAQEASQKGFYEKVSSLLGLRFQGQLARDAMSRAFLDLQRWSCDLLDGEYGSFRANVLGGHQYVGLAKAQALVSGRDIDGLHQLFFQQGLSPGQELSERAFKSLISSMSDVFFLTRALREACRNIELYGPVLREILGQHLRIWNGVVPEASSGRGKQKSGSQQVGTALDDQEIVSLVLKVGKDEDWEVCWESQMTVDAIEFQLRTDSFSACGYPDETGSYLIFQVADSNERVFSAKILEESASQPVRLNLVQQFDGFENGEGIKPLTLPARGIRSLIWDSRMGDMLVERPPPLFGPVYFLTFDPANIEFLQREGIPVEGIEDLSGLPAGAVLAYIEDSALMTGSQRRALNQLLGGTSDSFARARLRLVGGCPITRGGSRQYAPYDLPAVELDAGPGVSLRAEGLDVSQVNYQISGPEMFRQGVRRFVLEIVDTTKHHFWIEAVDGSEVLSRVKLKVSLAEGASSAFGGAFSLGRFGESLRSPDGLRGSVIGEESASELATSSTLQVVSIKGKSISQGMLETKLDSPALKLLDIISQRGGLAVPEAKKFIGRITQGDIGSDINPIFMMLDMKSRGFLEIETDQRGHLVKLHAVHPSLNVLPIQPSSGKVVLSPAGSLRSMHWKKLFLLESDQIQLVEEETGQHPLAIKIIADSVQDATQFAEELGLPLLPNNAFEIVNWSASLQETRNALRSNKGYENYAVRNLERFNPQRGLFSHDSSGYMKVDRSRGFELFRIDDAVIGGAKVYMLGTAVGREAVYNFIQDYRWAVWFAVTGLAEMLYGKGFYPWPTWPIHYRQLDASVILPARLRLPTVLERTLLVASGGAIEQFRLMELDGGAAGELNVLEVDGGGPPFKVDSAYTQMLDGPWLRYQPLSKELASRVVEKIGGRLEVIG